MPLIIYNRPCFSPSGRQTRREPTSTPWPCPRCRRVRTRPQLRSLYSREAVPQRVSGILCLYFQSFQSFTKMRLGAFSWGTPPVSERVGSCLPYYNIIKEIGDIEAGWNFFPGSRKKAAASESGSDRLKNYDKSTFQRSHQLAVFSKRRISA